MHRFCESETRLNFLYCFTAATCGCRGEKDEQHLPSSLPVLENLLHVVHTSSSQPWHFSFFDAGEYPQLLLFVFESIHHYQIWYKIYYIYLYYIFILYILIYTFHIHVIFIYICILYTCILYTYICKFYISIYKMFFLNIYNFLYKIYIFYIKYIYYIIFL